MKRMLMTMTMLVVFSLSIGLAGTYSGGTGTSGDPYQIATTDDLIELSNTSGDWREYFIQTADIAFNADEALVDWDDNGGAYWDTEDQKGFSPIGNGSTNFVGSYDGGGYTIDNLYINRGSTTYIGLFGYADGSSYADGSTITNISMTNVDITGNIAVGGLVGYNYDHATVSNCYSTGSVGGNGDYVGGLVGYNRLSSTISNSYSTGSVSGSNYVGGLVGNNYNNSATVSNCYSTGSVTGSGSDVGGLVGNNENATVSNSFWDTETSGQSSSEAGTGKTTEEMSNVTTFTDETTDGLTTAWDFVDNPNDDAANDDIWSINASYNGGYPYLTDNPTPDVPLPICLASFTAEAENGFVELAWRTASETNNACFLIYRNDEVISSIEGAGTTSEPHDYVYTDNHVIPGNTYTYVLADVTIGNKEVKHSDKSVTITAGEGNIGQDYSIGSSYPNPFNPICMIPLNLATGTNVNAGLHDINGRLVNELHNGALSAGSHDLKIDGANLATGIYLVKIRINDALHVQKIVLMK